MMMKLIIDSGGVVNDRLSGYTWRVKYKVVDIWYIIYYLNSIYIYFN